MVVVEPTHAEGDQTVHPWGLDAAPTAVRLLVVQDPLDRFFLRSLAERTEAHAMVNGSQCLFDKVNKAREAETGGLWQRIIGAVLSVGEQLIDGVLGRYLPDGLPGQDYGQRDDTTARPAGETINAERSPRGQQHHFGWKPGRAFPLPLPEQRQPNAGEHPRFWDPAARQDELAGAGHGVGFGVHAA